MQILTCFWYLYHNLHASEKAEARTRNDQQVAGSALVLLFALAYRNVYRKMSVSQIEKFCEKRDVYGYLFYSMGPSM